MTDKPTNALIARTGGSVSKFCATPGSDVALSQLQACCDRLNEITKGREGWRVVGNAPNRTIAKAGELRPDGKRWSEAA